MVEIDCSWMYQNFDYAKGETLYQCVSKDYGHKIEERWAGWHLDKEFDF